jgi:hypothetical protein
MLHETSLDGVGRPVALPLAYQFVGGFARRAVCVVRLAGIGIEFPNVPLNRRPAAILRRPWQRFSALDALFGSRGFSVDPHEWPVFVITGRTDLESARLPLAFRQHWSFIHVGFASRKSDRRRRVYQPPIGWVGCCASRSQPPAQVEIRIGYSIANEQADMHVYDAKSDSQDQPPTFESF